MCGPLAQVFPSQLIKLKTKRLRDHLSPFQFCPDCIGGLWNGDSIVTVLFINNQTFTSYISAFALQIPDPGESKVTSGPIIISVKDKHNKWEHLRQWNYLVELVDMGNCIKRLSHN